MVSGAEDADGAEAGGLDGREAGLDGLEAPGGVVAGAAGDDSGAVGVPLPGAWQFSV